MWDVPGGVGYSTTAGEGIFEEIVNFSEGRVPEESAPLSEAETMMRALQGYAPVSPLSEGEREMGELLEGRSAPSPRVQMVILRESGEFIRPECRPCAPI